MASARDRCRSSRTEARRLGTRRAVPAKLPDDPRLLQAHLHGALPEQHRQERAPRRFLPVRVRPSNKLQRALQQPGGENSRCRESRFPSPLCLFADLLRLRDDCESLLKQPGAVLVHFGATKGFKILRERKPVTSAYWRTRTAVRPLRVHVSLAKGACTPM